MTISFALTSNEISQPESRTAGGRILRRRAIVLLSFSAILAGCNISFYFTGWENAVYGTTKLDKSLILRQEGLRKAHKNGTLGHSPSVRFQQVHSVKYVVQREKNDLYLIFFGTDNPTDIYYSMIHWKEPAWTDAYPSAGIRVHAGFHRPYMAAASVPETGIRDSVKDYLKDNPNSGKVYIAGHSAGGSQALICAFDIAVNFPELARKGRIYSLTGGSPAAGNRAFAAEFNKLIGPDSAHRYLNGSDQMPSFLTPQMGFAQVGTPYRIGALPDAFVASTALWLADHFIWDYADSVRKLNP